MLAIDGIYNVSTTNTLSTPIQGTILHYLSGFQRKIGPIRRRSDHLMNSGLDREITAASRSVDGELRKLFVRKRIRVGVPNKSALLWMSCLSQYVGNICAADLIILLVRFM